MIRIVLPIQDYQEVLRDMKLEGIPFTTSIYTPSSATAPTLQAKFINGNATIKWGNERLLPGELAKMALKKHVKPFKMQPGTQQIPPPRYFTGEFEGDNIWHVDIKAAYATVYSRIEAEIKFTGTRLFSGWTELQPVMEMLKNHKSARNAVPGLMTSSKFALHHNGRVSTIKSKNPFYNPNVYNLCNYYMQRLARAAIDDGGAVYWNTDGGFLRNPAPVVDLAHKFNLNWRIDNGRLTLNSWGVYDFIGREEHITRGQRFNRTGGMHLNNVARF